MLNAGSTQSTGLTSSTGAQFSIYLLLLDAFLAYMLLADESIILAWSAGFFLISFCFSPSGTIAKRQTHTQRERGEKDAGGDSMVGDERGKCWGRS